MAKQRAKEKLKLQQALTYAGALPFLACAVAQLIGYGGANPVVIGSYWGIVIVMFMAGSLWGLATAGHREAHQDVLVASNAIVLAICGAVYWFALGHAPIILAIGFAAVLGIDYLLARRGVTGPDYFSLRVGISALVIICLLILAFVPEGGVI